MADYTVAFSGLNALLQSLPANSANNPYSINVTGLTSSNIGSPYTSGTLGYVLKQNNTKFVDLSETILPNSVISMSACFRDCTSLTTAPIIPNSVNIMYYCFYGCTSITTVPIIPNSVNDMRNCFYGCTSLTIAPNIPNSVTNMGACFSGCTSLTTVPNIPNSVTNMNSCFYGCTSLTTVPNIPNSVTNMAYCFEGCTSLTTVPIIPNSVPNMNHCFEGCTSLKTVPNIPNSVTDMGICFYGCTSLTTVPIIPNSVTNMANCFQGCTSLTEVSILVPSGNLETSNCFYGTTQSIIVKTQNKDALKAKLSHQFQSNVTIQDRYDWDIPFSNLNSFLQDCITYTTYDIKVTDLTPADMSGRDGLGGVIYFNEFIDVNLERTLLPHGTTSLVAAFDACRNLIKPPVIPNTVTDMSYCFADCTGMTDVPVIPNSVTNMKNCFNHCISITEAPDIPSSVTDMESCFSACTSLVSMPYIADGVTTLNGCFSNCTSLINVTNIPASVRNLERCFYDCSSIASINNIPQSVTSLSSCFYGCSSLATINDFQVNVDNCTMTNCFSGCTSLVEINVSESAPNATKWQFVHAIEDNDGITMTIETDDTEPVEVETIEHTYGILGLICDMLFSADAFASTRISNYLASRMPWIVESPTSLDANEDWTVLWAKDPTKVKSNCFALKGEVGGGSSAPIGSIIASGADLSNEGYILCDGRAVSRSDYAELFAKVGTTFGSGDGSTTFNVPNIEERVIEGASSSIGETGGEATHTLTVDEMPSHTHRNVQWVFNGESSPSAGAKYGIAYQYNTGTAYTKLNPDNSQVPFGIDEAGGGQSHNIKQPFIKLFYFVKARNISQQEVQDAIDDSKTTASNVWSAEKVYNELHQYDDSTPVDITNQVSTTLGVNLVRAKRTGNTVYLYVQGVYTGSQQTLGQADLVSNLPQKYRPSFLQTVTLLGYNAQQFTTHARGTILSNGSLNLDETSWITNTRIESGFTYMIN